MYKSLSVLLCALSMNVAYASYQQQVSLCVDIPSTHSFIPFFAGFKSTDFFDSGNTTPRVSYGTQCVTHTYKSGPKNIALYLWPATFEKVSIGTDGSCEIAQETGSRGLCSKPACVVSNYKRVEGAKVAWKITLTPDPRDLQHRYNLHCERVT